MSDTPFYTPWAEHYDQVFPVGPKAGFVADRIPAPARLLDIGCATGGLAFALAQCGYRVHGVDLDPALVARAAARLAADPAADVSFTRGDMLALPVPERPFDAVVCFGNTLPHLLARQQRVAALRAMAAQVGAEGRLLLQIVNYDRILARDVRQLPLIDNDAVRFERRYADLCAEGLRFEAVLTVKATEERIEVSQPLFPLTTAALGAELREAGWSPCRWWGGFGGQAHGPDSFGCVVEASR